MVKVVKPLRLRPNVCSPLFVLILALALVGHASAGSISFSGGDGNLSASALFALSGNTLTVTLTNTSMSDVLVPTDVLTAVWFNTTSSLNPVSASLNGSSVFYGSITNAGDGWGYYSGLAGGGEGKNNGITAAGFGIGSGHSNFSGAHNALGGLDYGLLSKGDNPATGNSGVTNHGPLVQNSSQFTFSVGPGFNLNELGNTVVFQYGTSLSDEHYNGTPVPVPESDALSAYVSALVIGGTLLRRMLRA
jgi:hypothetical protein